MLKQRQCELFPDKSDCSARKWNTSDNQYDSVSVSSRKNTDFNIDFAGLLTKNDELNKSLNKCLGSSKPVIQINSAKSNYGNVGVKPYRSKSVSPSRLTVPQPFKMTLRYFFNIFYLSFLFIPEWYYGWTYNVPRGYGLHSSLSSRGKSLM